VSALFLSAHCQGATQARGHEVGGPRGAWAVTNLTDSVDFSVRVGVALNTPNVPCVTLASGMFSGLKCNREHPSWQSPRTSV
jgi:hypothetical protein